MNSARRYDQPTDHGSILPLVLVVAVALSLVVVALVRFVSADLVYARVTEERAQRKASAISAISYGVERLRLGQTLCNNSTGSIGPVTPGVLDRNGTTTTLTCSRFGAGLVDITGWAVVITGSGISDDLLTVQGGGTKRVYGPMYINDVSDIRFFGGGPTLQHQNGDLWHRRNSCPGGAVTLPGTYTFVPANARGTLCTTLTWNQVVGAPTIPDLSVLPVNDGTTFTTVGTCRVFAPGRYTHPPDISGVDNNYFQSGSYWFDSVGEISVRQQSVWFGHHGTATPVTTNAACAAAVSTDPNNGGPGAVAYMGGNSYFDVETQGSIEFFSRLVGDVGVSLQTLSAGSGYTASSAEAADDEAIVSVGNGTTPDAVFRGMVYAPNAAFHFDNSSNSAKQQLLGGAVVARMSIAASASASGFVISVASTPTLTKVVMTATASDANGATTVQAVVDYRPDETDLSKRVAINSLRVVD